MVRLHEVYEDAEHAYIIMENCKGGDLETMLEVRLCGCPGWTCSLCEGICVP